MKFLKTISLLALTYFIVNNVLALEAEVPKIDSVGTIIDQCAVNNTYRGWLWVDNVVQDCRYFTFDAGSASGRAALSIGLASKISGIPVLLIFAQETDPCVGTTQVCRLISVRLR